MNKITCEGMGSMRMGKSTRILVILILVCFIAPILIVGAENVESQFTRQAPDEPVIFLVSDEKTLNEEDVSLENPIIINSSGRLTISNGVIIEIYQKFNYQYNITIKDNGTLRLQNGNLESNFALYILLQDKGKLILEKTSSLKVTKLFACDTSLIRVSSSTISPGKGGLEIDVSDQSAVELIDGSINNADKFVSQKNTRLEIRNGTIKSGMYAINCKELNLVSNTDFQDLQINSCEKISIQASTVSALDVTSCKLLTTSGGSVFKSSKIRTLKTGELSYADIDNLRFDSVTDLNLYDCTVNNLKITTMVENLKISKSEISQLDIEKCQKLETYDSIFDNSRLQSSLDLVEFRLSTIRHCSMFPKEVRIYDSIVEGNENELNDLTRGTKFEAQNSSFNSPLHFTGTTEAHLINCSTMDQFPPKVIVEQDSKIYIYWWLEVKVLANNSQPLAGATVQVCDFITNEPLKTGWSDVNGIVKFSLLGNTITKDGWKTKNNKSYFIKGIYGDQKTQNGTGIWMKQNKKSVLDFTQVKESEPEDEPLLSNTTLIGILIFIVIIILIGLSVRGGKKSTSRYRDSDRPPSRTVKPPAARTSRDNGYAPPGQRRPPRSELGRDTPRGTKRGVGLGSGKNGKPMNGEPPQRLAINRRLK